MMRNLSMRALALWLPALLVVALGGGGEVLGADPSVMAATRLVLDAGPGAPELPARTPNPEEPARLTLKDAIRFALAGNRDVQIASYNPERAREELKSKEAVYDPSVFSGYTLSRTDRPIQSQLDTGSIFDSELIEERWSLQLGIKKALPIGGTLTLSQEVDRLESNSSLVFPNPQSTSRVKGQLTQPILKGFGGKENRSAINIAKMNVAITDEEFRQRVLDVAAEVARTYWQLVFDHEMVRISRQILAMAEEVYRREVARQDQGISRMLDVNRARATAESRRGDLLRAVNRQEVTYKQLKLLMNSPDLILPADSPAVSAEAFARTRGSFLWGPVKLKLLLIRRPWALARLFIPILFL